MFFSACIPRHCGHNWELLNMESKVWTRNGRAKEENAERRGAGRKGKTHRWVENLKAAYKLKSESPFLILCLFTLLQENSFLRETIILTYQISSSWRTVSNLNYYFCVSKLFRMPFAFWNKLDCPCSFVLAGNSVEVDESLFQDMEDLDMEDDPDFNPLDLGSDEDWIVLSLDLTWMI